MSKRSGVSGALMPWAAKEARVQAVTDYSDAERRVHGRPERRQDRGQSDGHRQRRRDFTNASVYIASQHDKGQTLLVDTGAQLYWNCVRNVSAQMRARALSDSFISEISRSTSSMNLQWP